MSFNLKKDLEQNGAKKENPELKIDLLHYVLDKIETVNGSVQKAMLKSIVTCLLGWQRFSNLKLNSFQVLLQK